MRRRHIFINPALHILLIGALVGSSMIVTGCSTRRWMVQEMTAVMQAGTAVQEQDDDLEMIEAALPANIKLLETLLASSPGDRSLLILLSRQYGSYSFGFLTYDLERAELVDVAAASAAAVKQLRGRLSRYYQKGTEYAQRALDVRYPQSRRQLASISSAGKLIDSMDAKDVPALFWFGFNLSGYVNLNRDSIRAVSRAHLVQKAMQRVLELEPSYFHHSAHLILMAYYASRSPMMGGNLEAARKHHQALGKASNQNFLLNDVLFARYYLYQKQDRPAFIETLSGMADRARKIEEYRLFNAIAVKRARLYLEAVDQLIEPESTSTGSTRGAGKK